VCKAHCAPPLRYSSALSREDAAGLDLDLSMAACLSTAIDHALRSEPAPEVPVCLMDVVRIAGDDRQGIVVDAQRLPLTSTMIYSVMFADGQRAEYTPWELSTIRAALPVPADPALA
jgi:hypothetical protein